ncbi:MAG TPA: SdrD B-like domain-containing protein [Actinomycetes bacterium]|nr:SdrD B-like domain-containing protein [Actinomycetes bacterium]
MIKLKGAGNGPARRGLPARLLVGVAAGTLLLMALGTPAVIGVHDEAFELDGNIDDANPAGGPEVDWDDDIVGVGANGFSAPQSILPAGFAAATAGPDFTTIIRRGVEVAETGDDSTFTTNSKDILDISAEWRCVHANNVTDKGDLVNTYAVAYTNAANELILYFGAEKNDASGTNNLGVWFLQDQAVDCTSTQGGSGTAFTGSHVAGDVLVVSEFTGGGTTASITAYVWDPTNPAAVNNLVQLGTSGRCDQVDSLGLDDRLCAITNVSADVNPPWKTWDKDTGSLDFIAPQQFYEGAINVTAFGLNPCISTLLTNTRSSVSTTATLYDFAQVPFSVCGSKSGAKFHDLNANGVRDTGEPGLGDWTINLYTDPENNDVVEAGQAVFKTTQTAADGTYSFSELFAGNYIVCEELQDGWFQSRPVAGQTLPSGETLATCPGGTTGYGFALSGTGGQTGNDFGNFQPGAVTGTKFKDKDDDGVRDAGEQGLGGWEIHAFNADTHLHTTTAADGTYSFTLNPGTYTICETLSGQTGWVQSAPATGADCTGHTHGGTITPGATGHTVTVVSQGTVSARDFGNTPLSQVKVDFLPQATLPGGGDATHATSITCTPGGGNTDSNTFTTSDLRISQGTTITCVITYVDP